MSQNVRPTVSSCVPKAQGRLIDLLVILYKQRSTRLQRLPTQASTPLSRPDQMVEGLESTRVYMTPHRCERLIHVLSSWRLPPCRQNLTNNTTTGLNVSDQIVPHASRRRASERLIDLLVILCKQRSTRLQRHPTQATTQLSCPHRHELCQTGETTRAGCSLLG